MSQRNLKGDAAMEWSDDNKVRNAKKPKKNISSPFPLNSNSELPFCTFPGAGVGAVYFLV